MTTGHGPEGVRHRLADRLFHWGMAVCILVLLATAFLPILGIRFAWLPWHWTFGVALAGLVLFHLYRALIVHGLRRMLPGGDDLREVGRELRGAGHEGLPPAKYDAFQKAYHWAAALSVLAILGSGLPMLIRIDTMFWNRNPAVMSEPTWGVVYVIHGAASLLLIFLLILHVYFAILPEHRAFLRAMLAGRGPENARGGHS